MRRRTIVAAAALMGAVACGVSSRGTAAGGPSDGIGRVLVDIALGDSSDVRAGTAHKQLRRLAEDGKLASRELERLATLSWPPYLESASYFRTLATGGAEMERLLLERVRREQAYRLLPALGLADRPAEDVTSELRRLADSLDADSPERSLVVLVLAARRDESEDWVAELLRWAARPPEPEDEEPVWSTPFWDALPILAPRLKGSARLQERLLEVASLPRTPVAVSALLAYPLTVADGGREEALGRVSAALPQAPFKDLLAVKILHHLVLARLAADPGPEMRAIFQDADTLLDTLDAVVYYAEVIVDDRLALEVERALTSESVEVRRGAVVFVVAMGYDANRMLLTLEKVIADPDPQVAEWALVARIAAAGLTAQGQFVYHNDLLQTRARNE